MQNPATHSMLKPLLPILAAHLFPKLDGMLVTLLRSRTPEDWEKQTVSPKWKVKDVAAHLLDTTLRGLSVARDRCSPNPPKITSSEELATFINQLNHEGVAIGRGNSRCLRRRNFHSAGNRLAHFYKRHRSRFSPRSSEKFR